MDSLSIPEAVESLFPNKTALFQQMRAFEQDLKSYTKAKITNIKEDILRKGHKVKRTLRLMLEASQNEDGSKWCVRLEGRVLDALT